MTDRYIDPSLVPRPFFPIIEREGEGGKNGLVFIARVVVRTRISITQILGNRILQ